MSKVIAKYDLFPSSLTVAVMGRTTFSSHSSEYNGPKNDCIEAVEIEATEMFMIL